jgi:hypothetical protein
MRSSDVEKEALMTALGELRTYDVSAIRADRLRARCHRVLEMRSAPACPSDGLSWPPVVRLLAGAWCIVYLFETIRRTAAVYGL